MTLISQCEKLLPHTSSTTSVARTCICISFCNHQPCTNKNHYPKQTCGDDFRLPLRLRGLVSSPFSHFLHARSRRACHRRRTRHPHASRPHNRQNRNGCVRTAEKSQIMIGQLDVHPLLSQGTYQWTLLYLCGFGEIPLVPGTDWPRAY